MLMKDRILSYKALLCKNISFWSSAAFWKITEILRFKLRSILNSHQGLTSLFRNLKSSPRTSLEEVFRLFHVWKLACVVQRCVSFVPGISPSKKVINLRMLSVWEYVTQTVKAVVCLLINSAVWNSCFCQDFVFVCVTALLLSLLDTYNNQFLYSTSVSFFSSPLVVFRLVPISHLIGCLII